MAYNIHAILVHFPIALLFLYSFIKVLPFERWFPNVAWRDVQRILLVFGVLGAFAALATGDTAEHLFHPNRQLVDMHANFAGLATALYSALLAGEAAAIANGRAFMQKPGLKRLFALSTLAEKILCNKAFSSIVAFLGLIAISVTGLLGGAMVYGASADPVAGFVLKILGINL